MDLITSFGRAFVGTVVRFVLPIVITLIVAGAAVVGIVAIGCLVNK